MRRPDLSRLRRCAAPGGGPGGHAPRGGRLVLLHHPDEVPWPLGPDGEPEEAVRLSNLADFPSVQTVVQARFQAAGIPVLTRYPEGGGLGKVYLGFSGYGVDLYVPKSRESEARALLLHDE